jgi:hypothetical protein
LQGVPKCCKNRRCGARWLAASSGLLALFPRRLASPQLPIVGLAPLPHLTSPRNATTLHASPRHLFHSRKTVNIPRHLCAVLKSS